MDQLPLWGLFLVVTGALYVAWEIGYRFGRAYAIPGKDTQTAATIATALLPLSAFILGFTFNMATTHFQERRDVLIEDVNAIGTTYLRAGVVAEPERSEIRRLLREYVDARLKLAGTDLADGLRRSTEIHNELWQQTVSATEKDRTPIAATLITTMNDLIDLHTKRLTIVVQHRVPDAILFALIELTALSVMTLGYQNGLSKGLRSAAIVIVGLTFGIAIVLVVDLDRPGQGLIGVDQQPMIELKASMNAP